ncbi:MAG: rod shape-determining protein MreD, partial [Kiloniellaceae bacterium]
TPIWTRLDLVARSLFPFAFTLLLVMVGMVHLRLPGFSPIVPSFGLIAVYYWAIHRPGLMPSWAVFLIGLIQDLLGGGPLGVTIVVLLLMCAVISAQRRFLVTGSFVLAWAIFLPMAAGVFAVSWLLHGLLLGTLIDARPAVFQYLTTVAVYPCCAWLFARAQRSLLR